MYGSVTCEIHFVPFLCFAGEQVGRHLLLLAIRSHGREADRRRTGGQKSQKDGRGRSLR